MLNISSINFNFDGQLYQALVRVKHTPSKEYYITIMNGKLESLFFGNHTFVEEDGQIRASLNGHGLNGFILRLQKAIARALQKELKPEIANYGNM